MAADRKRPDDTPEATADTPHDKARALGEQALDDLAHGREAAADRHVAKAKRLDPGALREIVEELDEDAGANPDAVKDRPG
jgi:hypothetical protein